jgi:DNA modification methylase
MWRDVLNGRQRFAVVEGDCLARLREMDAASVQACVTSPPYWGLRDYGVDGQLGNETTPGEYIAKVVALFREVKRVLRDDGVLWLNLGDSYVSDVKTGGRNDTQTMYGMDSQNLKAKKAMRVTHGLKAKELVGIPWRAAFALQADGWYLRTDIIWAKPNPMPESVTDRPTRAHEYIFMLTKQERYFYNIDATRTPHKSGENKTNWWGDGAFEDTDVSSRQRARRGTEKTIISAAARRAAPAGYVGHPLGKNERSVWSIATKPLHAAHFAVFPWEIPRRCGRERSALHRDRAESRVHQDRQRSHRADA